MKKIIPAILIAVASSSAFASTFSGEQINLNSKTVTAELTDLRGNILFKIQVPDLFPAQPEVLIYNNKIFIGGTEARGSDHINYHLPLGGVLQINSN